MPLRLLVIGLVLAWPAFAGFSSEALLKTLPYSGPILPDAQIFNRGTHDVGLYIGKGTWTEGKEHLKMFLTERQINYRSFTAKQVLDGEMASSGIRLLIMPGGESWEYIAELGAAGEAKIKAFVNAGGGYLGICAGAFYATSHREGGQATGKYGIGLLEGTAYDGTALHTPPFIDGMMDFNMALHPLTHHLAAQFRIVMFGGPSLRYTAQEAANKQISVLSRFQQIDEPAMVVFNYGAGRVFLAGPHFEIEEDRTEWGEDFKDPDSEWPLLLRLTKYLQKIN